MMHEVKAIYIIWLRELIRYWRNKVRSVSGLMFPLLWLVVMGSGLSSSLRFAPPGTETQGLNYIDFLFPGILAMTLLFTSIFGALSIVYDREFGFFKEIFVAPVSRSSIVLGKILGGATTATIQASLMFILAPFIGISISLTTILLLIPAMFVTAFGLSSIGVLIASRMKSTETFPIVMQFFMMPMFFLSGALFPLRSAPDWLSMLSRFNPLTYGVNLLRQIFFMGGEGLGEQYLLFDSSLFGVTLTASLNLSVIVVFSLVLAFLSTVAFSKME